MFVCTHLHGCFFLFACCCCCLAGRSRWRCFFAAFLPASFLTSLLGGGKGERELVSVLHFTPLPPFLVSRFAFLLCSFFLFSILSIRSQRLIPAFLLNGSGVEQHVFWHIASKTIKNRSGALLSSLFPFSYYICVGVHGLDGRFNVICGVCEFCVCVLKYGKGLLRR